MYLLIDLTKRKDIELYVIFIILIYTILIIFNIQTGVLSFAIWSGFHPLDEDILFPLTYSLAICSFLIFLYWFRNNGIFAIPLAIGVPFLWVITFEILWQNSFILTGHIGDTLNTELILISLLLMGIISLPEWKRNRISVSAIVIFTIGWITWLWMGYPQIPSTLGYMFNITLKIGAFAVIMILVMPYDSI